VRSGAIGRIASVEHLEPINWYHFAHSYVRGNWSRESESSSMLLSKSCHDIDWLSYVICQRALRVSSFGSLMEFRPERKPAGAGTRCVDCAIESTCTYSALRIYNGRGEAGFADIVRRTSDTGDLLDALRTSSYGRCVYEGTNDAVDHQVVTIEYEGGATASFTAVAFSDLHGRQTRIFGTEGTIEGDGTTFTVRQFRTGTVETHTPRSAEDSSALGDHGGADGDIVDEFLAAVAGQVAPDDVSGPETTLETHRITWAAERARVSGAVVTLGGPEIAATPFRTNRQEVAT
jgi:predicted dehydrogenase